MLGVEEDNDQCMFALASYYRNIKDIDNMIIYYKKLLPHRNAEAFYELARYSLLKENNVVNAMKYAQIAQQLNYDKKEIENILLAIVLKKNVLERTNILEDIDTSNFKIINKTTYDNVEQTADDVYESNIIDLKEKADCGDVESIVNISTHYILGLAL